MDAQALNERARELLDSGDPAGAVAELERARSAAPGSYPILWNLARAHRARGDRARAREAMDAALALNDADADGWALSGLLLWEDGDSQGAIAAYRKAVAMDPDCAEAWNDWGVALFNQGKMNDALEKFERAAALAPRSEDVLVNLRDTLGELGYGARARECSERLAKLGVKNA